MHDALRVVGHLLVVFLNSFHQMSLYMFELIICHLHTQFISVVQITIRDFEEARRDDLKASPDQSDLVIKYGSPFIQNMEDTINVVSFGLSFHIL